MKIKLMIARCLAAALASLVLSPASAQKTKSQLTTEFSTNLPDNQVGTITPAVLRGVLADMTDSWQQYTSVNTQTGATYNVQPSDYGELIKFNSASSVAVSLAQATGSFYPFNVFVTNVGAGTVTITPTISTINGASSFAVTQNESVWIVSDGTNWIVWNSNVVPGQLSGFTANAIYKGQGLSPPIPSALTDDGSKVSTAENFDLTSQGLATEIANAGTTGTTLNKLAKLTGAPSTAVITATSDTSGAIGVVIGGAGTTGNALIATSGQASCVFDGATTAGDYVQISSTVAGDCHDAGVSPPSTGQVGRVLSTNATAGTYAVAISGGSGGGTAYVTRTFTCDGTTDVSTAFQSWVNANTGKTLFLPPGPACVIGTSISLPSNTTLIGGGWGSIVKSTIAVDSGASPVFSISNTSNVVLSNFWIEGTNAQSSWTTANAGVLEVYQDASCSAPTNIQFTHMKVTSFNSVYWMFITTSGCATAISNLHIDDNTFITDSSSPPTSPANGENNYVIEAQSGTTGGLTNSTFDRNNINSTGACFGILLFGQLSYVNIDQNNIQSPGQTASSHCNNSTGTTINAYGISIYDLEGTGAQQHWTINGNIISAPYASGIYLAGTGSTSADSGYGVIAHNNISGQTSSDNASLPRAAIAVNAVTDVNINSNDLQGNFGGIDIASISSDAVNITSNHCISASSTAGAHCIRLTPPIATTTSLGTISLTGNTIQANNAAVTNILMTGATSSAQFGTVDISSNSIEIEGTGINASSQFFNEPLRISGNALLAPSTGTYWNFSSINYNPFLMGNELWNTTSGAWGTTFANLPGAQNGSQVYVNDGTAGSSPCTGSGTGSTAFRQNGAWKCF